MCVVGVLLLYPDGGGGRHLADGICVTHWGENGKGFHPMLVGMFYAMLPAFDAILGHRSAHSLETGPVIAEPFISPLLLTMTPALSSK